MSKFLHPYFSVIDIDVVVRETTATHVLSYSREGRYRKIPSDKGQARYHAAVRRCAQAADYPKVHAQAGSDAAV